MSKANYIEIRGARCHNLKNINLKIPRRSFVVITGPSGSGKSSLAFDTIFAEGQRRYVESLSTYARQFLEKMSRAEVDRIEGIPPAIAIQQKAPTGNPRSTVGTATEIYDYLRLLYARIGDVYCVNCGKLIRKEDPQDMVNYIEEITENSKFYVAFKIQFPEPENLAKSKGLIISKGFIRIWQDGHLINLSQPDSLSTYENSYIVVDRLKKQKKPDRNRIVGSIETAFFEGEGYAYIINEDGQIHTFSQNYSCSNCGYQMIPPQPRLFSFNNPFGACPGCQGFGDMMDWDMNKIVPDPSKPLRNGAIAIWNTPAYRHIMARLSTIAPKYGFSMTSSFADLTKEQKQLIVNGSRDFVGIKRFFEYLERKKYKVQVRVFMSRFRSYFTCTECHGNRLRPEALAVKIGNESISALSRMNIRDLRKFFSGLQLTNYRQEIASDILKEINQRLNYLNDVGLSYLDLNRRSNTLSGGEFQRINLATALGTALTETLYILDEPTIGLHPRDTNKLIRIIKSLSQIGNTLLVVEHDPLVMEHATRIVDLGPASGELGGEVIYEGTYKNLLKKGNGLTAEYLQGKKNVPIKKTFTRPGSKYLTVKGAREHNLKNIDVEIPLGLIVAITGVSGSGKSTLVYDILYRGYQAMKGEVREKVGDHDRIEGTKNIKGIIMVDQSPIGRTPRSNPITYIKCFDEIRKLFADTPQARARNFRPGHFSFNVPGGRCEVCQGDGQIKIEMQFLADVYIKCEACNGKRYESTILDIYWKGKNITDVLDLTVDQARDFFSDHPVIIRKLQILKEVGLGYLKLGQPATTLSGGEAQRIKLAAHLSQKDQKDILFIFDEPTTGLHFDDIAKLLRAFDQMVKNGASVLIIEHNLYVIRYADWIIDLGPGGGNEGGNIIARGTPPEITWNQKSYTGKFLKAYLNS